MLSLYTVDDSTKGRIRSKDAAIVSRRRVAAEMLWECFLGNVSLFRHTKLSKPPSWRYCSQNTTGALVSGRGRAACRVWQGCRGLRPMASLCSTQTRYSRLLRTKLHDGWLARTLVDRWWCRSSLRSNEKTQFSRYELTRSKQKELAVPGTE